MVRNSPAKEAVFLAAFSAAVSLVGCYASSWEATEFDASFLVEGITSTIEMKSQKAALPEVVASGCWTAGLLAGYYTISAVLVGSVVVDGWLEGWPIATFSAGFLDFLVLAMAGICCRKLQHQKW